MKFSNNERVKVQIARVEQQYVTATVVGDQNNPRQLRVTVFGEEIMVDAASVVRINFRVNNAHFLANIRKLENYLEDGWARLIPAQWRSKQTPIQVIKDKCDPKIKLLGGTIEIVPGIVVNRSIGRYVESCGYTILTYKHYPATRSAPEDYEDIELATVRGEANAAAEALKYLWLIESDNYWTSVVEQEYAEELAKEEA